MNYSYLKKLTNETGIWEHAVFSVVDKQAGYCTDDNARALQVAIRGKLNPDLAETYLKFLVNARDKAGFHNDLGADLKWQDEAGLGEAFGRAMESLAETAAYGPMHLALPATLVFDWQSHLITKPHSNRVKSHLIWALYHRQRFNEKNEDWKMMKKFSRGDGRKFGLQVNVEKTIRNLADEMVQEFESQASGKWLWFEKRLVYDNARLPWGLWGAAKAIGDKKYLQVAMKSLDWLIDSTWDKEKSCFSFVGNKGWWEKGKRKAVFDQQAIDAGSMVEACIAAYGISRQTKYKEYAHDAFAWYRGKNILGVDLLDKKTGGIRNGLVKDGFNPDEGAESVLSYLLAGLELKSHVENKK